MVKSKDFKMALENLGGHVPLLSDDPTPMSVVVSYANTQCKVIDDRTILRTQLSLH